MIEMEIEAIPRYWCKCGQTQHPHKGIRLKDKHGQGNLDGYIGEVIKFCCNDMKEAFDEEFIVFGKIDDYCSCNADVNITMCKPYPEGIIWEEMPIKFCPFCKEKIVVKS